MHIFTAEDCEGACQQGRNGSTLSPSTIVLHASMQVYIRMYTYLHKCTHKG